MQPGFPRLAFRKRGRFDDPRWNARVARAFDRGARLIRQQLESRYGEEYGTALVLMGKIREKLLTEKGNSAYNKEIFNDLADRLPALIRDGATAEIENLLKHLLGPEASLAGLGLGDKDTE